MNLSIRLEYYIFRLFVHSSAVAVVIWSLVQQDNDVLLAVGNPCTKNSSCLGACRCCCLGFDSTNNTYHNATRRTCRKIWSSGYMLADRQTDRQTDTLSSQYSATPVGSRRYRLGSLSQNNRYRVGWHLLVRCGRLSFWAHAIIIAYRIVSGGSVRVALCSPYLLMLYDTEFSRRFMQITWL